MDRNRPQSARVEIFTARTQPSKKGILTTLTPIFFCCSSLASILSAKSPYSGQIVPLWHESSRFTIRRLSSHFSLISAPCHSFLLVVHLSTPFLNAPGPPYQSLNRLGLRHLRSFLRLNLTQQDRSSSLQGDEAEILPWSGLKISKSHNAVVCYRSVTHTSRPSQKVGKETCQVQQPAIGRGSEHVRGDDSGPAFGGCKDHNGREQK